MEKPVIDVIHRHYGGGSARRFNCLGADELRGFVFNRTNRWLIAGRQCGSDGGPPQLFCRQFRLFQNAPKIDSYVARKAWERISEFFERHNLLNQKQRACTAPENRVHARIITLRMKKLDCQGLLTLLPVAGTKFIRLQGVEHPDHVVNVTTDRQVSD